MSSIRLVPIPYFVFNALGHSAPFDCGQIVPVGILSILPFPLVLVKVTTLFCPAFHPLGAMKPITNFEVLDALGRIRTCITKSVGVLAGADAGTSTLSMNIHEAM